MKYILLWVLIVMPLLLLSQDKNKGIQFETALTWQQVLEKAKTENKSIFVDCYATWCGPCKEMDAGVYLDGHVGDYMNAHFISVKAQFDTSKVDNLFIQRWYSDAHGLMSRYKIIAFPTFLFFSPAGQIINRASGLLTDSLFLRLASDAINDPERQYYSVIAKFHTGEMDYCNMPGLAKTARANGNEGLADSVAKDYVENYLDKQSEEEITKQANLNFIKDFFDVLTSQDKVFNLLYHQSNLVDETLKIKGYSQFVVDSIITKEEIAATLWPNGIAISTKPNWNKMHFIIEKKYNRDFADRLGLEAKIRWYTEKKDWDNIAKYTIKKYDIYGLDTTGFGWLFINNFCYEIIFKHSTNRKVIAKATNWMQLIVKSMPHNAANIDTYANLLYKAGKYKEALFWEEKAVQLLPENDPSFIGIKKSFQEMKEGKPTWNP